MFYLLNIRKVGIIATRATKQITHLQRFEESISASIRYVSFKNERVAQWYSCCYCLYLGSYHYYYYNYQLTYLAVLVVILLQLSSLYPSPLAIDLVTWEWCDCSVVIPYFVSSFSVHFDDWNGQTHPRVNYSLANSCKATQTIVKPNGALYFARSVLRKRKQ